jgi:hypothetical protein
MSKTKIVDISSMVNKENEEPETQVQETETTESSVKDTETPKSNSERIESIHIPGGKKKVSRDEFAQVLSQISDNINQIANYLMEDMNTLYSRQVFPFQIRLNVIEDILIEKGITTKEEITERADEYFKKLQEQAKEIKEREEAEESSEESDPEDVDTLKKDPELSEEAETKDEVSETKSETKDEASEAESDSESK